MGIYQTCNRIRLICCLLLFLLLITATGLFAVSSLEEQGLTAYLSGDLVRATQYLEKAIATNQASPKASVYLIKVYLELSHDYFDKKQYSQALGVLNKALKMSPDNKDIQDIYRWVNESYQQEKNQKLLAKKPPKPKPTAKKKVKKTAANALAAPVTLTAVTVEPTKEAVNVVSLTATAALIEDHFKAIIKTQQSELLTEQRAINETVSNRVQSTVNTLLILGGAAVLLILLIFMFIMKRQRRFFKSEEEHFLGVLNDQNTALAKGAVTLASKKAGAGAQISTGEMLSDPNPRIRAKGIELLDQEFQLENTSKEIALKVLNPFAMDPNNRVLGNVAKAMYRYDPNRAKALIKSMLENSNVFMRLSAVWVCGEIGDPIILDMVINLAEAVQPPLTQRVKKTLEKIAELKNPEIIKRKETIFQKIQHLAAKEKEGLAQGFGNYPASEDGRGPSKPSAPEFDPLLRERDMEIKALKEQINKISELKIELQNDLCSFTEEQERLKESLDRSKKEALGQKKSLAEKESELREARDGLSELEENLKTLSEDLARQKKMNEKAESEKKDISAREKSLQAELVKMGQEAVDGQELSSQLQKLEKDLKEKQKDGREKEAKLDEITKEMDRKEKEFEKLLHSHQQLQKKLLDKEKSSQDSLANLKEEMEQQAQEARKEREQLKEKAVKLEEQVKKAKEDHLREIREIRVAGEQGSLATKESEMLRRENESLQHEIDLLKIKIEKLSLEGDIQSRRHEEVQAGIKESADSLTRSREEVLRLQKENAEIKKALEYSLHKLHDLENGKTS